MIINSRYFISTHKTLNTQSWFVYIVLENKMALLLAKVSIKKSYLLFENSEIKTQL